MWDLWVYQNKPPNGGLTTGVAPLFGSSERPLSPSREKGVYKLPLT